MSNMTLKNDFIFLLKIRKDGLIIKNLKIFVDLLVELK